MFRKIKRLFFRKDPSANFPTERMSALLDMLARTTPDEISCEDVGVALAEFVEMHHRGEDVTHLMPLVHQHLEMCPDCREEYEAIMAALAVEGQMD